MKARMLLAAMAATALPSEFWAFGESPGGGDGKPFNPKLPFSPEELEHMAGLSGKAKKQYIRELKRKYLVGGRND